MESESVEVTESVEVAESGVDAPDFGDMAALDAAMSVFAEAAESPEEPAEAAEAPEPTEEPAQAAQTPPEAPPSLPSAPQAPSDEEQRVLARIAEKEREMFARMQQERAALEAQRAEIEAQQAKLRDWEEFERRLAEEDVLGALESRGWKLEDLGRAAVEGRGAAPLRRLEAKLAEQQKAMQEQFRRLEQERVAAQQAQFQAQLEQEMRNEISTRSPVLAAAGQVGYEAVMGLAERYRAAGQRVTYDQLVPEAERTLSHLIESVLSVPAVRERYLGAGQASSGTQAKAPRPALNTAATQVAKRTQPVNLDDITDPYAAVDALFSSGNPFDL